jgi:hypothetical protein
MYGSLVSEVQHLDKESENTVNANAFMDVKKIKDSIPKQKYGRFVRYNSATR